MKTFKTLVPLAALAVLLSGCYFHADGDRTREDEVMQAREECLDADFYWYAWVDYGETEVQYVCAKDMKTIVEIQEQVLEKNTEEAYK